MSGWWLRVTCHPIPPSNWTLPVSLSFRTSTRRFPLLRSRAIPHPQMLQSSLNSLQVSMASLHNRKRRNSDDSNNVNATAKRTKFTAVQNTSNHPPKFWDNLSKVWLTPRALRELDRRNDTNSSTIKTTTPSGVTATTLARFARHGGPDLRHLRGVSLLCYAQVGED